MRRITLMIVASALVIACQEHEFHPPDREEQVVAAGRQYSSALFDTITWESAQVRVTEGNNVYAVSCRKCHGSLGEGDTDYAREQNLNPPSLVAPDWPHAASIDSVRYRIFVGHESGMPSFGIAKITPREIDAVAHYIVEQLRPEAMQQRSP